MRNNPNQLQKLLEAYALANDMTRTRVRKIFAEFLNVAVSTTYSYTREVPVEMPLAKIRKAVEFFQGCVEVDEQALIDFYYPVEETANA